MKVLLVRAGALGDVLLLRRGVGALVRAGHVVHLLAPARPGRALVGPGEAEVSGLTPWDGPALGALLAGDAPPSTLEAELRSDVTLAFTDAADVVEALRPFSGRVLSRSPRPKPVAHASLWLAAPAGDLGGDPSLDPAPLQFTAEERGRAMDPLARLPRQFLALHPGSGSPLKSWPSDRFEALARHLEPTRPFLLVVGPADEDAAAPLERMDNAVVARDLPVRVLGALLSQAGVYVGNDSGVTHLAAAAGAPTVALFGPTDPAVWAPLGPRVEVVKSVDGPMESVRLEDVAAAAERVLR